MTKTSSRADRDRAARRRLLALALMFMATTSLPAGAAEDDDSTGPGSGDFFDRLGSSVSGTFKGAKEKIGLDKPPPPPQKESPSGCPSIEVLDGTGAQRISAGAGAGNEALKYQYSIVDVARECTIGGNQMTLKVGVQGKVLLGPQGAPGQFDVPIRIVVVDQAGQKPLLSKLYRVPASISAGQTSAPYALVADSLVVPVAAGHTSRDYGIKIGIDTNGKATDVGGKPAKKRHKAQPAASANE